MTKRIFFSLSAIFFGILLSTKFSLAYLENAKTDQWLLEPIGTYRIHSESKDFGGISAIIMGYDGQKFTALTDEIVNFGVSSHDDCVDALVWLCNGLMTRGKLELEY